MQKLGKTISLLGSGWLGLELARHFVQSNNQVKASTRSENRLDELSALSIHPFVIDLDQLSQNIQPFLNSDILIVNIPSKNIQGFRGLIKEIETSAIKKIVFVSSTSVYSANNKTVFESDETNLKDCPLRSIELLFLSSPCFETSIVRFAGLIGASRHPGRFFKEGRLIPNPDSPVNMIHRQDCVAIIDQIIVQDAWGETFNCAADSHPNKRDFIARPPRVLMSLLPFLMKQPL